MKNYYVKFVDDGGLENYWQLFGEKIKRIIAEINQELAV